MSPDPIEQRLGALPKSLSLSPNDARAIDSLLTIQVEATRPRWWRPRQLAVGMAIAALLIAAGNLAVAYYAPVYGQALAAAPYWEGSLIHCSMRSVSPNRTRLPSTAPRPRTGTAFNWWRATPTACGRLSSCRSTDEA
jgi:hypothetical protein